MSQYDQLDRKDLECMVCRKHKKKALHFAQYCLWQVRPIMNLASDWLAYYNLRWSGFRHIAFQIRLRLLKPCNIDPNVFMCFFDEPSLFTNVSLYETIKICSEALYDDSDLQPLIPQDVFVELMKSPTSYSFNNTMYKQTDEVVLGLPLRPVLANIFVGYYCIKKSYFLKCRSLQHTSDMLTTRLPSSITKLKQMIS